MQSATRAAIAAALALLAACGREEPTREAPLALQSVLAGDSAGFARAVAPRTFHFPDDHGPHPAFRTEWWYYTGNLRSAAGERYGFQLTFFRSALSPDSVRGTSPWRTRQAWMAHFALTDAARSKFRAFERFSRGAVGLAGARAEPYRVWLYDWEAAGRGTDATPVMTLRAGAEGAAIDLVLEPAKPPVLQGDAGLSRKGSRPGNASYYYSLTRMRARGVVRSGSDSVRVEGAAWMDREWSTSVLEEGQVGWDWFALQLDDSTDVMVYHIRRRGGETDPRSRGVVVDARGNKTDLPPGGFDLEVLDRWRSPSGTVYPSSWRLAVPSAGIDVAVEPLLDDQELNLSFRYWEGAVRVRGTHAGYGYVELTGYDEDG